MSEIGDNFIFTHITKNGGMSVRETLRLNFSTTVRQPFHAKADPVDRALVFTFVRHPAFWLRSYWANREDTQWAIGGGTGLWNQITRELQPFYKPQCSEFIINVAKGKPGIVGDYFQRYFVDGIKIGRTEMLNYDLLEFLPEIERFAPSSNVRSDKPPISVEAFETVSMNERWLVKNFYPDQQELLDTIWIGDIYETARV